MPSKLEQLQLQFRRRLKEEQMTHTHHQQKALSKVPRYNGAGWGPPPTPLMARRAVSVKRGSFPGVDNSRPLLPPISRAPPTGRSAHSSPPRGESATVDLGMDARGGMRVISGGGEAEHTFNRHVVLSPSECFVETTPDAHSVTARLLKQKEMQRFKAQVHEEQLPPTREVASSVPRGAVPGRRGNDPTATTDVGGGGRQKRRPPPSITQSPPKPKSKVQVTSAKTSAPSRPFSEGSSKNAPRGNLSPPGPDQCTVCGRTFSLDRVQKHTSICQKASQKRARVFDAARMRVKGTEAEQFQVKKGLSSRQPEPPKAKKSSDWRKKHADFIEAIRQAKILQKHLAKGGKVSDLPPPPPSDTSDYLPCPHCGRRFSEAVAERHVPKCKDIRSNKGRKTHRLPPPPPQRERRGGGK